MPQGCGQPDPWTTPDPDLDAWLDSLPTSLGRPGFVLDEVPAAPAAPAVPVLPSRATGAPFLGHEAGVVRADP